MKKAMNHSFSSMVHSFSYFIVLFYILQGIHIHLAGADLDHLIHIVYKDLAVSDVTGVQGFLGRLDDCIHRDAADEAIRQYNSHLRPSPVL